MWRKIESRELFLAQANLVSKQTRIYSLRPDAANRLNTVYMAGYFVGGALGAALGSLLWNRFGWISLCALGAALFATALTVLLRGRQFAPALRPS